MTTDPEYVFVYGTLKKGFGNHRLLAEAEYVGPACVKGHLISLGGFPGLIYNPHEVTQGEVYRVTSATQWERLDRLEGFNKEAPSAGSNMYLRRSITTIDTNQDCEVYYWNGGKDAGPAVTNNTW